MAVDDLQHQIRAFRDARGSTQFHTPKDMPMAISIEAAEPQEHFLYVTTEAAQERREQMREEIAGIRMCLFEFADNLGIDFLEAIAKKLKKNAVKSPVGKAKGQQSKYPEL